MYHNIPNELREWPQWVTWRYEVVNGRQTKVPYTANGQYRANVNDPATWGTFNEACQTAAGAVMHGIGFVLTANDPYTGIDIDDKESNPASEEELVAHDRILRSFVSYTERSVGARWIDAQGRERGGHHIIIKGKIAGGRDRGHVGVYSTGRYLTFNGEVVRNAPIGNFQPLLDKLVEQMPDNSAEYELLDVEAVMTDREVHEMAMEAYNGEKYDKLCQGKWEELGYPSRSEADLALISILAYYTRDNEQVRRLFRYSVLGSRDKHKGSNQAIDRCLKMFRSQQPQPADVAALLARAQAEAAKGGEPAPVDTPAPSPAQALAPVAPAPPPAPVYVPAHADGAYAAPPGLVGDLAQYLYSTAIRPVPEAALVGAIALMAGIAGRAYNISGTGLNQYLLFVAKTGTGKEAIETGINKVITATRAIVPMADEFLGPSQFASGQGLIRVLDKRPSFVSVMGEFGLTLQALSDPRAPAAMVLLRRVLLDLYTKSGWQSVLRETAYSDTEKNTKIVAAPAVSIVGETTPETFYEGIDASDIADGLIPRFHIVEYKGERPMRNPHSGHLPQQSLIQSVADLMTVAITSKQNMVCNAVQLAGDAQAMMDAFDLECDEHMRGRVSPAEAQVWNRAHLKALKLGALLAVGVNPHAPIVDGVCAQWAIDFVRRGCEQVLARFHSGDVGNGQTKQVADVRRIISEYFKYDKKTLAGYKAKVEVQQAGFIPYSYLTVRGSRLSSFSKDRNGYARALKAALDELVAAEALGMLTPQEAFAKFQKREALYYLGANW